MELTVGDVAQRAGISVPTLRYYEQLGLVVSSRTTGNQRRYERSVLRRLAVVAAGRRAGMPLADIGAALAALPRDHAPSQADWTTLSTSWRASVQARIAELERLRDDLDGCIGCGCLSLARCALYNPSDEAASEGPGARWVRRAREASEPR